ncbi:acetolactate synthase 2 catalytic subunit [Thalassotalea aquiviva]|uniref:acetolactate synthase 2 catalytic subunit n=1 Tax=Thalassotalea aquiviva TaxID=3242415 RepID=UPI00352A6E93
MNGAQLVLNVLQQQGVTDVFGYPGGAIMPIYDALYDSAIKHYLCRHEQGAGFSAIGYARAHKTVGVCLATSGPGATNLITALADAMSDSVPIVAITGQVSTQAMGSDAFQEVDIIGLSLAVTKHCIQVRSADELADIIEQAFVIAQSGRMGPVLIDIPKDIQLAPCQFVMSGQSDHGTHQQIDSKSLAQAKSLLQSAQKPVVYVGGGVGMANGVTQLRAFLGQCQVPSVSTLKGLGAVAPNDPLYLGMLGMHGTKAANLAVQQCDLLLVIGARFDDRVTGKLDEFAPDAKVIHVDIDAAEIDKRRPADVAVLANLPVFLEKLVCPLKITAWQQHCQQLKAQYKWCYQHPGTGIFAPALLAQLSTLLPTNSVVTTDVGQHQMWVAQHMSFEQPQNFLTSGGQGAMGFGLPSAIGAQVARHQDAVVAVCGDGSFMMNVQELATLKRYQLPVKVVLIDNARLGMVRQWQQLFFQQRYSETDLSDNPEFTVLASAFGIKSRCIHEQVQVEAAFKEMLAHPGPYLLHVKIDAMENVWPLVPPESSNEQMLESL